MNVVLIVGGSNVNLHTAILKGRKAHISIIQSPADDGGSGGAMRREFNMVAPGDMRRALVALSTSTDHYLRDVFLHRFTSGPLKGQVIGNLILAGLTEQLGSFEKAIAEAKKILAVRGEVLPASLKPALLCARFANGVTVKGESRIELRKHTGKGRIVKAWFDKPVPLNPKAKAAIEKADAIIIGPGDLYSSLIPNFLVSGLAQAVRRSKAKKIFITNALSRDSETPSFTAADFINALERYAGPVLDAATVGTKAVSAAFIRGGVKAKKFPAEIHAVTPDLKGIRPEIKILRGTFHTNHFEWSPTAFRRVLKKYL